MAITDFQRGICRLIADQRKKQGESYVAGGVALNTILGAPRISKDIDLFHDTEEALAATWAADRQLLAQGGYAVEVARERPTFVEAAVRRGAEHVVMQWACDSTYRFFPLMEHSDFGLVLHPFDLATNKLLAMVGRLEVRDWVDLMSCSHKVQHLGYLAWTACGKDPGYNPAMILAAAAATGRYSAEEVAELDFAGAPPNARELSRTWKRLLVEAEAIIDVLPAEEVGKCVLGRDGALYRAGAGELRSALARGDLVFRPGSIRGALPVPVRS